MGNTGDNTCLTGLLGGVDVGTQYTVTQHRTSLAPPSALQPTMNSFQGVIFTTTREFGQGWHYTFSRVWGSFAHRAPRLPRTRVSLPRHDLLGEERWPISQRRRARSLFLNGLLLGSICTGIQVKLISHCQAVRIKQ